MRERSYRSPRALTIRQPWASLIAAGVKTIETRSWQTGYRGPLLIHAGKALYRREDCEAVAEQLGSKWPILPLGAVVAVADLVDVVPMIDVMTGEGPDDHARSQRAIYLLPDPLRAEVVDRFTYIDDPEHTKVITDQLPLGDFTPGRYAWLLANVRPITPVPAKGKQGLWTPPPDLSILEEVTHA